MKKIFILALFVCICTIGIARQNKQLKDGLYLVDKMLTGTNTVTLKTNQVLVHFNHDFVENAPDSSTSLVVNTSDFVPLVLGEEPVLLPQTETKKKLQLTFSRLASEKLEQFTSENVMKQVTMIVNGEALTVNKIREAIRNGKMEITRCSDNACQKIYVTLKNHNVEKKK
jgi:hypothetical protein